MLKSEQLLSKLKEAIAGYSFPDEDKLISFDDSSLPWCELISSIAEALANEDFESAAAALEKELQETLAKQEAMLAVQEAEQEPSAKLTAEKLSELLKVVISTADYSREDDLSDIFAPIVSVKSDADELIPGIKDWLDIWVDASTTFNEKQEASKRFSTVDELSLAPTFASFIEKTSNAKKLNSAVIKRLFS